MTRSLVFCSQKGGVGKTSVALNSAFALARRDLRTLLVDLDPQGSIGMSIQGVDATRGIHDAFVAGEALLSAAVTTRLPTLSLLPFGHIAPLEVDDLPRLARESALLTHLLSEASTHYDLVLFDAPAGISGMTRLALESADHAVAVVQCEPLALRALPQLLELLAQLRERGNACGLLGVAGNMTNFRDPVVLASMEEIWSFYRDEVFETTIPRDPAFLEASRAGVPLGLLSRRPPPVAVVFERLAAEIEARLDRANGPLREGVDDDGPIRLVG